MRSGALRVLYVSPFAELGGAERTVLDLLALHDRAAVEPSICFLRDGPLVARCRDELGIQTSLLVAPRLRRALKARRVVSALANLVVAQQVDLVNSSMAWGHVYGGRAARRAGRPSVWFQQVIPALRPLDLWAALVKTNTIIANSHFTAAAQRRLNPLRRPIAVIHLGTRLPTEPRALRRQRGRAALGVGEGEFAVGIVGRLQRWKGQDVVLRAAASLIRARPRSHLFVIGGSLFGLEKDFEAELRRLAQQLGIAGQTVFTGHRDDVADCLAGLDVAVHASVHPEPFGLVLIEAMAAGTALVAADGGGAREIVRHGSDGLLVPPGDHEALAVALLDLCDDPPRRAVLAAAGERTVRERFDVTRMTRSVEALYRAVVRR